MPNLGSVKADKMSLTLTQAWTVRPIRSSKAIFWVDYLKSSQVQLSAKLSLCWGNRPKVS